jgi:glycosyltransferase involved in cell wall biosynthesis
LRVLLAHKFLALTGGAEVFYREVGRVLTENGHEVRYLCTGSPDDVEWPPSINQDQVTFIDAPDYANASISEKLSSLPQIIWSTSAKAAANRLIEQFEPDLMHVFGVHVHLSPSILVAAKERGIPTVMTCNDYKHICPNYKLFHHNRICFDCKSGNFTNAIVNRCAKESLSFSAASALEAFVHRKKRVYERYVDHYTFSADFMAEVTQEFWSDREFSWSKVMNPFDSRSFVAPDDDDGYGLYFGRLIDEKGVHILIEAAANIGNFPIKIIGSGPDEQKLRNRVSELGISNVEFLGALWDDDLAPMLSRARFVAIPSIWHENFPYVVNQSFAFGRPVIGSNRGGITELVDHGVRGLIYDAQNIDSLAESIRTLAENPTLARQMGRTAKEWSDATFVDDVFYDALMNAYERAHYACSNPRG